VTTMSARYRERRQAAIAAGTWQPRTDGGTVRAYLARLRAAGASYAEIGTAADDRIVLVEATWTFTGTGHATAAETALALAAAARAREYDQAADADAA
jgi:hypothetical protein